MTRFSSSISLALGVSLALSSFAVEPALAATKFPKGDVFWTVSDYTGSLYPWDPIRKVYKGQSIDGPEDGTVQGVIIGGGWDGKKKRFVLVDGWDDGTAHQGLLVYDVKTTNWTRYAIDMGDGTTYGFQIRDVASTSKGQLVILVKNAVDADPAYSHYIVPIGTLNAVTHVATANWASRVQIRHENVSYVALSYDPDSNKRIFVQSPDYTIDTIGAANGAVLDSNDVEASYSDLVHFDIDSSNHFWAYGGSGYELIYGILGSERDNTSLGATNFTSTLNCLIIQRKAK